MCGPRAPVGALIFDQSSVSSRSFYVRKATVMIGERTLEQPALRP
jgi:hypothetical protein